MKSKERGNFEGEQNNSSEWDSLSNFEVEQVDRTDRERQERKLMAQILLPESRALGEHDATITPEAEQAALEKIASDDFNRKSLNDILTIIQTPVHKHGAEAVFNDSIVGRDAELMMLASFTDQDNYLNCSASDVDKFLKKFPSPADYESYAEDFLAGIEEYNTDEVVEEFRQANENLKQSIYGKREEYFQAFKELERRAYEAERNNAHFLEVYEIEKSAELFAKSKCEGDLLPYSDGSLRQITKDELAQNNLVPTFRVEMGDTEVGISQVFSAGGHDSAIAFVNDGKKIMQRALYKSNSQGTWRLMPEYALKDDGGIWYGKGYSEESMQLPRKMQVALSEISKAGHLAVDENVASTMMFGTAKYYNSIDDFRSNLDKETLRGQVYKEMDIEPTVTLGENGPISDKKVAPQELTLHGDLEPNFNALVDEWTMDSSLYGAIQVRCYKSADKKLEYMFCIDKDGHAWIGGVENNSVVNSGGVHKEWVAAGDYSTPPYEYEKQADGYGDTDDRRGSYVGMWNNYLSKMPVIQRFCHSLVAEQ